MSEGNVFGQPGRDAVDFANTDDRPVVRVPLHDYADEKADQAHDEWARDEADTNLEAKRAFRMSVIELAEERERLVSERSYLIGMGVDPSELEPIDGAEATKALHEAHPLRTTGPFPPAKEKITVPEGPLWKVPPEFMPADPSLGDQRVELDADVTKATKRALDQRVELDADAAKYEWDQNPRGKDSNPKDAIGSRKAGLSMLPRQVLYEVGLGMLEGALKYARHNYRIAGVRASVYKDANDRHMDAWWEGQDIDPGSGLHHVVKAIASLVVLRDSMIAGNWYDDRPPSIGDPNWLEALNKEAERIIDAFEGEPKKPFIKGDNE